MQKRRTTLRSRHLRQTHGQQPCPPQWVWLLTGVFLGMFLSFLIYLRLASDTLPPRPADPVMPAIKEMEAAPVQPVVAPAAKAAPEAATPSPRFEFYDLLRNTDNRLLPRGDDISYNTENSDDPALPAVPTVTYTPDTLLQVGSFRNAQEAQGLLQHLASLGIAATIQQVVLNGSEHWYRVRVGPFTDQAQLDAIRMQLGNNNLTSIVAHF